MLLGITLSSCAGTQQQSDLKLGTSTLNVARSALAGDNPRLALNIANAVLKTNPTNLHALLARGDALYLLDDCTRAAAAYRSVLAHRPRNVDAELGLGRCALQRTPRAAAVNFERAIHDDSMNAVAFNDLGIAEAEQSQFSRAIVTFRKSLSLDSSMRAAKINLGMALALGGHPDRAEIILGPLARDPGATPKIRADYATALVLGGNMKGAEDVLNADMPATEARSMVTQLAHLSHPPNNTAPTTTKAH